MAHAPPQVGDGNGLTTHAEPAANPARTTTTARAKPGKGETKMLHTLSYETRTKLEADAADMSWHEQAAAIKKAQAAVDQAKSPAKKAAAEAWLWVLIEAHQDGWD